MPHGAANLLGTRRKGRKNPRSTGYVLEFLNDLGRLIRQMNIFKYTQPIFAYYVISTIILPTIVARAYFKMLLKITQGSKCIGPQEVDLWVRVLHVCVGTAACPWTADFRPCAPQAKIYRFVPFFFKKKEEKEIRFL